MNLTVIAALIFLLNVRRGIRYLFAVRNNIKIHRSPHVSFFLSLILCSWFVGTLSLAMLHGMGNVWLTPIQDIYTHVFNTPIDDALKVKQALFQGTLEENSFVVFYRWDCEDCSKFFSEYTKNNYENIRPSHPVHFVSTRSFLGYDIAQHYQIANVPTICKVVKDSDGTLTLKPIGDSIKLLYK